MIEGYWTILLLIMLFILLVTGWKTWLAQHFNLTFVGLSYVSIFIAHWLDWIVRLNIHGYRLTIDGSIILVILLQLIFLMYRFPPKSQVLYSAMPIMMLAFLSTISHAIIIYSPWAKSNVSVWYIPVACGVLLAALGIGIHHIGTIVFWGSIAAEGLLLWQQKGEYIARIGNLLWWDMIAMTIICSFIFILILETIVKIGYNFISDRINRTKS